MKSKKRVMIKTNFSIYDNFKLGLKYLKESRKYIWFAFLIFLVFSLIGFLFPVFFEKQIINLIKDLVDKTEGLSWFGLIGYIFLNNLKSSFFALLLGIFFGIFPLISAIVNGYVLGFVAKKTAGIEGFWVLWRLLPHGIFEIPAVMISMGLGLKLGAYFFVKDKKKKFKEWILNSIRVFIFIIIPLLIIAAIIEGSLIHLLG
ncbi:MAG: stage II sporulation protein M [Candidatus Pacearchaeota archaeon]